MLWHYVMIWYGTIVWHYGTPEKHTHLDRPRNHSASHINKPVEEHQQPISVSGNSLVHHRVIGHWTIKNSLSGN